MTEKDVKLSAQTWIPIGVAVGGLITFFWAGVTYNQILNAQETQAQTLKRIEVKVDQTYKEAVSIAAFKQWLELLKAKNPSGVIIPDFR